MSSSSTAPHFTGVTSRPEDVAVDLLFVPVFGADDTFDDLAGVQQAAGGELERARSVGEFRTKAYECLVVPVGGSTWKAKRLAFIGAGPLEEADAERVRRVASVAGYVARQRGAASIGWVIRRGQSPSIVADGLSTAEFESGAYKSSDDRSTTYPSTVQVVVPGGNASSVAGDVARGRVLGEASNFARSLANEPGNVLTPREFARRVETDARRTGLSVDVLDETQLKELNMRLLLGVAQGSAEPPRLIVLRHEPANAPASPVLAFVGKGVTFDSGGISIKPADGMERMKDDMAGGAAVAAALAALSRLNAPFRILGLIPTTENMPGGKATRPGDVVVGASGKSVEIINTDAEGRLILADALWYAQKLGATHLVDIATLTGACIVALGRNVSGLFGQPEAWVDRVRRAATVAGDRVWPLPIYEEARSELRSEIADMINAAGRPGGAITAAAFLREFAENVPWAHLDIAGTAWAETKKAYQPKGATGVAVRTLVEIGMNGVQ